MPVSPSADSQSRRAIAVELLGYLIASALALALDTGIFGVALAFGTPLPIAAALGFAVGVTFAYFCSIRFVFRSRRLQERSREFAAFVVIGLVGLLLTEALLWLLVTSLRLPPLPAKLITAGIVFLFNFGVRKALLFNPAKRRPAAARDSRLEPLL